MQAATQRLAQSDVEFGGLEMGGTSISHWLLMVLFFAVLFAIPVLWYVVGIRTYGTGDYHQP